MGCYSILYIFLSAQHHARVLNINDTTVQPVQEKTHNIHMVLSLSATGLSLHYKTYVFIGLKQMTN